MKAIICILAMFVSLNFASQAAALVGKVDIQKVLVSINEGKKVRDKLKKEFDKKQGLLKKDEAAIKKMQEKYKKQSVVMKAKAKAKMERDIQAQIVALQQKSLKFQEDIRKLEQSFKAPILGKVKKIVEKVSKSSGVDFTYEVSSGPIVYAKKEKDITNAVIKAYNKAHK